MIIIKNTLEFKLKKEGTINLIQNNVAYSKKLDKIMFDIDEANFELSIKNDYFELKRTTQDSIFTLIKDKENKSMIYLKEQDVAFDILVEYLNIQIIDNKYIIEYKLESDEENTTIEININ